MESFLRGVECANCFGKFSLLQLFFNRQTKLGQGLDIGAGMKFQILELGENRLVTFPDHRAFALLWLASAFVGAGAVSTG